MTGSMWCSNPKGMSPEELLAGHEWAWKQVYSHRAIFRRLMTSRTQLPLSFLSNQGYRFYAYHLHSHYTCDWAIGQGQGQAA